MLQNFLFKIWLDEKVSFQNLTHCIFFQFKIWQVMKCSNSKSCFLKKLEKCKICRFYQVKRTKTWFFGCKPFFRNLTCRKFFNSKSNALYFFQATIWRVVKLLNQNLTRCENFVPKSNALYFFYLKIWHVVKLFIQNLLFKSFFQILAELLSKCFQHQKTTCWKKTMARGKNIFLRVCGMCLSHVWHYLFGYCVLYGNWVLDGCDDYNICTTNWFIQTSLELKNG